MGRVDIIEMSVFQKLIHRFNMIPVKMPDCFFVEKH